MLTLALVMPLAWKDQDHGYHGFPPSYFCYIVSAENEGVIALPLGGEAIFNAIASGSHCTDSNIY